MGLERHDLEKFKGTNIQEFSGDLENYYPPEKDEIRIALYLVELSTHEPVWHEFYTVFNSLEDLLIRKIKRLAFGSTCEICGNKMKVVLQWEKERALGSKTPLEE